MPEFFFETNAPGVIYDDTEVYVRDFAASLMAYHKDNPDIVALGGVDGFYVSEGRLTTRELKASAITEIFSLEADVVIPDGCEVKFRVSVDNGTSWLYWNGVAWTVAGVNDFNTLEEINEGLASMAGVPSSLRFQIRMNSSADRLRAPVVSDLKLGLSYEFNFIEDVIRTVHAAIDQKVRVLAQVPLTSVGTDKLSLSHDLQSLALDSVYDLTTDPLKTTNLFVSYIGTEIKMSVIVATGHNMLVTGHGKANIAVAPDPDYVRAHLPIFCLVPTGEEGFRPQMDDEVLTNISTKKARVRPMYRTKQISVSIHCASKYEVVANAMVNALDHLFKPTKVARANPLVSLATGMDFDVVDFSPSVNNNITEDKLHEKTANLVVAGKVWRDDEIEVPIAEDIQVIMIGG